MSQSNNYTASKTFVNSLVLLNAARMRGITDKELRDAILVILHQFNEQEV